jgi:hypothetical protein
MQGRTLWIQPGDVDGPLDEGRVVTATRPLDDFCLRGDDHTAPITPGTLLEVIEVRAWGAAMAQELPGVHGVHGVHDDELTGTPATIMQAARELAAAGLFEIVPAEVSS